MDNDKWLPPVAFYFQVQFHWGKQHYSTSFMEVSGLGQELVVESMSQRGDDGINLKLAKEVKHGNIVLKRSITPIDEKISEWINQCFSFTQQGKIKPCMLVIFLMNEKRQSVACWTCSHAYPVKWDMATMNAKESSIALETLTLAYNTLERKK